jgi:hypothetical protein
MALVTAGLTTDALEINTGKLVAAVAEAVVEKEPPIPAPKPVRKAWRRLLSSGRPISWVLFALGILWVFLYPAVTISTAELKPRGTYFDENALLVRTSVHVIVLLVCDAIRKCSHLVDLLQLIDISCSYGNAAGASYERLNDQLAGNTVG